MSIARASGWSLYHRLLTLIIILLLRGVSSRSSSEMFHTVRYKPSIAQVSQYFYASKKKIKKNNESVFLVTTVIYDTLSLLTPLSIRPSTNYIQEVHTHTQTHTARALRAQGSLLQYGQSQCQVSTRGVFFTCRGVTISATAQ